MPRQHILESGVRGDDLCWQAVRVDVCVLWWQRIALQTEGAHPELALEIQGAAA